MQLDEHISPILFSAPMVRAILSGAKTQTRRVMKPQPQYPNDHPTILRRCPYGPIGGRLWVRNYAGEFDEVSGCSKTHYGRPGEPIKWRAFIDA